MIISSDSSIRIIGYCFILRFLMRRCLCLLFAVSDFYWMIMISSLLFIMQSYSSSNYSPSYSSSESKISKLNSFSCLPTISSTDSSSMTIIACCYCYEKRLTQYLSVSWSWWSYACVFRHLLLSWPISCWMSLDSLKSLWWGPRLIRSSDELTDSWVS